MSEVKEYFKAYREYCRDKRQSNIERSTALLKQNNIDFQSRNDGFHLLIETSKGRVNFYPSTGLYNGAVGGRGVKNLLEELKGGEDEQ